MAFSKAKVLTQPQREHSATIKEAPKAYAQNDTPKSQKIIEIDCRGLEFVEFKPDVISTHWNFRYAATNSISRASGRPQASTRTQNSMPST